MGLSIEKRVFISAQRLSEHNAYKWKIVFFMLLS
jgi:hypothetical protein